MVAVRSGIPFTIRIGVADVNRDNHTTYDRPFYAPRNSGRGANFYSADLRVMKQFFINRDSGFRVDFITEATNVFNKTNFLSVNDVFGTDLALLGKILFGPYDLRGSKAIPPATAAGLQQRISWTANSVRTEARLLRKGFRV